MKSTILGNRRRVGVVLAASLAAAGVFGLKAARKAQPVAAGAPVGDANILLGAQRRSVAMKSLLRQKWTFLIASSYPVESLMEPAEAVLAHAPNARFLFVVRDDEEGRKLISRGSRGDRILLAIDAAGAFQKRYAQPGARDYIASFLVDPNGMIQYTAPVIRPEEMRLLAERYLGASDAYVEPAGYTVGARIPAGAVMRVADGRRAQLADLVRPGGATILFFRANCTTCGAGKLVSGLTALKSKGVFEARPPVYAVFSHGFDATDLKQSVAAASAAQADVYTADAYVPDWEDPYYVGMLERNEIMVVSYSAEGVVAHVERYSEWRTRKLAQ